MANATKPDARTQWDNARAHTKLLEHEAESATKMYAVIDSMMANLHMSHGELLRLRKALAKHFLEDICVESVALSYSVLQS